MAEQPWDNFARLNAGDRFKAQSAEMGAAATETILEAARIGPDSTRGTLRVLDLACGSGEPSISMAVRLRANGTVVGLDLAGAALDVARERARARGLDNVEFQQGDVHALPFADESFDRVTSRLGVMFFADLGRALREIYRVLKPALATASATGGPSVGPYPTPGGRVALLAWGAMEQPYFETTIGTLRRLRPELEVPPGARSMFKFGEKGTLSRALREAGFGAVQEELHRLRWDWHGKPEEMWEYFRAVTVPFHPLLAQVEGDAEADRAVIAALRERFDGEHVRFEAEMVLAVGER
jgi:ubiquinone/menaquinone biosynthesis C-methylase UbiE